MSFGTKTDFAHLNLARHGEPVEYRSKWDWEQVGISHYESPRTATDARMTAWNNAVAVVEDLRKVAPALIRSTEEGIQEYRTGERTTHFQTDPDGPMTGFDRKLSLIAGPFLGLIHAAAFGVQAAVDAGQSVLALADYVVKKTLGKIVGR